jgi:HK97 family phage portal protein
VEHGSAARFTHWDDVTATATASPPVDRDTAMGLPGIGRGASIISSVIGQLVPQALRFEPHPDRPIEVLMPPPLILEPDPYWHGGSTWRYAAVMDLVFDGNVFADAEAEVDRRGWPTRLPLIDPARVTWAPIGDGSSMGYVVAPADDPVRDPVRDPGPVEFEPSRMFHAAVDVRSGKRMGRGIIETYQQTLRLIATVERATAVVMRSGRPVGVLSVDEELDGDELAQVKASFLSGVRADGVAALVKSDFRSVSWNASDLALVDTRTHNLRLAADILGIPPYLLGVPSESKTYSNNEDEWTNLIRISAVKYVQPLQDALTRRVPRGQSVRFPVDLLQRPDAKTRWEIHQIAMGLGATSIAEIRQDEGMGPPPAMDAGTEGLAQTQVQGPEEDQ